MGSGSRLITDAKGRLDTTRTAINVNGGLLATEGWGGIASRSLTGCILPLSNKNAVLPAFAGRIPDAGLRAQPWVCLHDPHGGVRPIASVGNLYTLRMYAAPRQI